MLGYGSSADGILGASTRRLAANQHIPLHGTLHRKSGIRRPLLE
jgi:hypothetical protein